MIKNISRKKVLSKDHKVCKSIFSKTVGLMFSLRPKTLIFVFDEEKVAPLHMFFVFFPIDVLYLDKEKKVVELKENFRPFTFYNPNNKAKYVVELKGGSIKDSRTKVEDLIRF